MNSAILFAIAFHCFPGSECRRFRPVERHVTSTNHTCIWRSRSDRMKIPGLLWKLSINLSQKQLIAVAICLLHLIECVNQVASASEGEKSAQTAGKGGEAPSPEQMCILFTCSSACITLLKRHFVNCSLWKGHLV